MITAKQASRPDEDICLLLTFDNHKGNYVCDCGAASNLTVKECGETKALFITHTHIDHFINFDTFIRHQLNSVFHTVVCGPEGLARNVWAKLQGYTWNLISEMPDGEMTYEVREYIDSTHYRKTLITAPLWEMNDQGVVESEQIYRNEKFAVSVAPLDHKIPSLSYRFQEHDTVSIDLSSSEYRGGKWVSELKEAFQAGDTDRIITVENNQIKAEELFDLLSIKHGDSLGFIMDHAGTEENHAIIAEQFHKVNQLFIESFYADEERETALGNAHSTARLSGKAAGMAMAKEVTPIHFSRKYKQEQRNEMRQEFFKSYREFFGKR